MMATATKGLYTPEQQASAEYYMARFKTVFEERMADREKFVESKFDVDVTMRVVRSHFLRFVINGNFEELELLAAVDHSLYNGHLMTVEHIHDELMIASLIIRGKVAHDAFRISDHEYMATYKAYRDFWRKHYEQA